MNLWNHTLVLGMHRGGTSAVAKIVESLGVPAASAVQQVAPTIDNPVGYGEAVPIMRLNDEVLVANGWTWGSVPLSKVPMSWTRADSVAGRRLLSDIGPGGVCVKDPRISAMLPFWRSIMADRIAAVVVLRHPLEAIWSLMVRDSLSPSHAAALWIAYHERLVPSIDGLPHLVLEFSDIVDDATGSSRRIADFLVTHDALGSIPDIRVDEASRVVDRSLVRHTSPARLAFHPMVASAISAYELLRKDLVNSNGVLPTTLMLEPETETLVTDILETRRSGEAAGRSSTQVLSFDPAPAISVILRLTSDPDAIRSTMQSIQGQLTRPTQVVAVGSEVELEVAAASWAEIASEGAGRIPIDLERCEGSTPEARNTGLARATGDLVAFIDAGDSWTEIHLRALAAPFSVDQTVGWCFSDFDVVDERGRRTVNGWLAASAVAHPRRTLAELVRTPAHVLASASIIRRSALEQIGWFDPSLEGAAVDELYMRMFQAGWRTIYTPDCFTRRRIWSRGGPEGQMSLDARLALVGKYRGSVSSTLNQDSHLLSAELTARMGHLRVLDYSRAIRSGDLTRASRIAASLDQPAGGSRSSIRRRLLMWMLRHPSVAVPVIRAVSFLPSPLVSRFSPTLSLLRRRR